MTKLLFQIVIFILTGVWFVKILVCLKQVNDNGDMNRFDEFALEEALKIRAELSEQGNDNVGVDIVTAGSLNSFKVIRRAFGMGADRGFHIVIPEKIRVKEYISPFIIASYLYIVASAYNYDMIFTGIMSQDMMNGATGSMLAEILGFPCVTGVVRIKVSPDQDKSILIDPPYNHDNYVYIEREMENGFIETLKIQIPCVLTIQSGINIPRYPCLSNLLAAEQKEIITIKDTQAFLPEQVRPKELYISMENPEKIREGRVLKGSLSEVASRFMEFLTGRGFI